MSAVSQPQVLRLSLVLGSALRDRDGAKLGRVDDLIVRLGDAGYPPITAILVSVARRQSFIHAEQVADIQEGLVTMRRPRFDLRPFERREGEVLLRKDVLDRQLINVEGARLIRANDIELARLGGWYRVVGVETSLRALWRRVLPRALAARTAPAGEFLDWASVEPFVGHVPSVRLKIPHPKLAKLHPAQIADLVEAASHREGEEIIEAVGSDRELEADVYEELDPHHQDEFIAERPDAEVAQVLARMGADDAADLLSRAGEERREALLGLMPAGKRRHVRALLGYEPDSAGGLMSPDFVCLYQQGTVAEALQRIRVGGQPDESLLTVYAMDAERSLVGALSLPRLLRERSDTLLADAIDGEPVTVGPGCPLEEVAQVMADYNLSTLPVVDEQRRLLGIVTVDDLLAVLLPKGWRRRFSVLAD